MKDGVRTRPAASPVEVQIVLVIDDDPDMRGALSNLLHSVGLRVEVFASAAELLQRELPDIPSCFVLDVRLQRSSGLDLHSELRRSGIKTPVVFINWSRRYSYVRPDCEGRGSRLSGQTVSRKGSMR